MNAKEFFYSTGLLSSFVLAALAALGGSIFFLLCGLFGLLYYTDQLERLGRGKKS